MSKVEVVACAAIAAVMMGLALFGLRYKRAAHDAQAQLALVQAQAAQCSQSVALLENEAKESEAAAARALAAAQSAADKHAQRADRLLRAPAAVPGDDCASARVRARAWLEGRR